MAGDGSLLQPDDGRLRLFLPSGHQPPPASGEGVYEDLDCFKLNDTLEVYGIISVNPVLSLLGEEKDPTERMATPEEQRAHDPPASLVFRLHMLCPLQHNNPLLPSTPTEDQSACVRNITALGNLISWQKVDYDFNYHQMEFPCNINVLVTSEGRSLLPSDCQVPLQPQVTPPNMEEYLTTIHMAQLTSQLNKFRVYLSVPQTLDYSISDEVTKIKAALDCLLSKPGHCYEPRCRAESNIE
ncbi:mini-chromosome maintenance complex-binding protein [Coregonus clupeaformis]|uniref:mini-chromosome maintenance complex-binding protein n=1 Tax=Coregonus clupeaformis TaxID=59861 RepID=UPI001BE005C0|nr:mini-chromosome maintenance complex-binding protein [Coregonus clupeaformis]